MRTTIINTAIVCVAFGATGCDNQDGQNDGAPASSPSGFNHGAAPPMPDSGAVPAEGADAGGPGDGDGGTASSAPPGSVCVWSADCPAGEHCDLGQCYAACAAASDCPAPEVCSIRGRCLAPGDADQDPPPVTTKIGAVTAEAIPAVLSDRDQELTIHLRADTADTVRYRVGLDAPYLSLDEVRGEFSGDTSLKLRVDPSTLTGQNLQGSVRLYTTLGSLVVNVPIQVGITGAYRGVLEYGMGGGDEKEPALALGRSEVVVDLVGNEQGDVVARVEPEQSLLFPKTGTDAMSGRGTFTESDGVDFTMKQLVPESFGGDVNPFRRSIGRQLHVHVTPGARGSLDGTFEETVFGLYSTPVVLSGKAHFDRVPGASDPPSFDPPADPIMPSTLLDQGPALSDVFPGWSFGCIDGCSVDDTLDCAAMFDVAYHEPLEDALAGKIPSKTDPLGDIAADCRNELALTAPASTVKCAALPALACVLGEIESRALGADADGMFGRLFTHTIDPALFVAQDDIVAGLRNSFIKGFGSETQSLSDARSALIPPLRWVLSAPLIERLRRSSAVSVLSGEEASSFTAARTLVRSLYVLSTIDAELAHLAAGDRTEPHGDLVRAAQEKALIGLFEAAIVGGLIDAWKDAPPDLGTEFSDMLTILGRGFASLSQGALTFGVPEGFIPMVYEPGRKPTNFEQEMDLIQPVLDQSVADETAFTSAKRDFELASDGVDKELENVRYGYDAQIAKICGETFDLDKQDIATCGVGNTGDVGALQLKIDEAQARLQASETRMSGMRDRIQVEWNRLTDVQAVRESTIRFTKNTGQALSVLAFAEGTLNAAEKAVETAAQSSITNGGAPVVAGYVVASLELAKADLAAERQQLQTAQEVRIQADNAKVEVINGMAVIKGLMIDMAQLRVEMRLDLLGVLEAQVDIQNSLATASRLLSERARAIARIGKNSERDASYRLLEDNAAVRAIRSRAAAQKELYLAGRALAYELNEPFEDQLGAATLNTFNSAQASGVKNCLGAIYGSGRLAVGQANAYSVEFSLRKLLGVRSPVQDPVTGETLDEGEQFRRLLLKNENIDGTGGVGIEFSSNLGSDNGLWPTTVCDDRIDSVEAQLVGDFIGDNQAEVDLTLDGGGVLRDCDSGDLVAWSTSGNAVIQAGVNGFGAVPTSNESLHGLSVASAKWKITIPGAAAAPSNADVDLTKLEDVTLRVRHLARPIRPAKIPLSTDCLASVGVGG